MAKTVLIAFPATREQRRTPETCQRKIRPTRFTFCTLLALVCPFCIFLAKEFSTVEA
jgi:hypothetical protein